MAINLDTFAQDLQDLFVKSCELSMECYQLVLESGADIFSTEIVMTPDTGFWSNFLISDDYITWLFPESAEWDLEMPVPIAVLKDDMSVKDWAQSRIDDWNEYVSNKEGSVYDE